MRIVLAVALAALAAVVRADESPPGTAWATCRADALPGFDAADLPEGVRVSGDEILFCRRTETGAATFDFAELDAATFAGATVRFADGEIAVDSLRFDPAYSLRFVGGADTRLKGVADKSIFDGCEAATPGNAAVQSTVWSNLTFACDAARRPIWRNGGAIAICGGGFEIADCTFRGCFAEEFGGAVYAPLLSADSTVTNCLFEGSWVSAYNGYGGAIYASGLEMGRTLSVIDSRFAGNEAVNGGAICTVRAAADQETPIALVLVRSCFETNAADFGGGAIFAEGAVTAVAAADGGTGSAFVGNSAGRAGGAICVSGIDGVSVPVDVTVERGSVFAGNVVSNGLTWAAGGAIAVLSEGCTFTARGVLFEKNDILADAYVCYGGALSLSSGCHLIDTCVFDCRTDLANTGVYGGAVDLDSSDDVQIRNCTFRFAEVEAISAYLVANLAISNCVIVGNGLAGGAYADVLCEMCGGVAIACTAYGSLLMDAAPAVDDRNLPGRTEAIYAGDDTLKLDALHFNPVAALGLVQPGVVDFEGVPYGSCPLGSSMGAYETPTEPLVVTLDGSKHYDGSATSNGCAWTWTLAGTNGVPRAWADLVDAGDDARNGLHKLFAIAEWRFGNSDVGFYASTNATPATRVEAAVTVADARTEWLCAVLAFVYTGTIRAALSTDLVLHFDPAEYAWTGGPITPTNDPAAGVTVVVSNTVTGAVLVRGVDYELDWWNNVDPTDAAKIVVNGMNNYADAQIVSNFFISAFCTKYFWDVDQERPVPDAVLTNGALSGTAASAVIVVPPGYCLDWQWPLRSDHHTNGTVYAFGRGGAGREDILTLWVDYERDVNVPGGDRIPDRYQLRVTFAVANGWWNGERNGANKFDWITLADSSGRWSEDGTGRLGDVPGVGEKPFSGFVAGEANGAWGQSLTAAVDRRTFPIYLFCYGLGDSPGDPSRRNGPSLLAASGEQPGSDAQLRNEFAIRSFKVDGRDAVSGTAAAVVVETATGRTLATTELAGRKLTICGAERPDGEWKPISIQRTGAGGEWSVGRSREMRFFKIVSGE